MKNILFIFILFLFPLLTFANDVKVKQIHMDGSFVYKNFKEETEVLVVFDYEGIKTKAFSGLEKLKKLKFVEMYNFAFLDDYSFLENLDTVENLYISACTVKDFSFLNKMKGLRTIEFWGYVPEKNQENLVQPIDLSNCTHLESVNFYVANYDKNARIKFKLPNENVKIIKFSESKKN